MDKRSPSRDLDQLLLRLPDGMRGEIKAAAKANRRSMSAEVVARLEAADAGLRDYMAAAALPQAVEDYDRKTRHVQDTKQHVLPWACEALGSRESIIARQAYRYADAMLAARGDSEVPQDG